METFTFFLKDLRLKPLKFTRKRPSKGENGKSKAESRDSPSDMERFSDSLLDPFLVEAISDFPANSCRNAVKDFANDYLNRASCLNSLDKIETEVVCTALPAVIQEAKQELDNEVILDEIISCVAENMVRAIVKNVLDECHAEILMPQQQQQQHQVAAFAAKELIDMFLLDHLMGKMSFQAPRLSGKEHLSTVLDSLMLDILLRQFFSIQQQQQATSENVPLRDFRLKAFTEVALDVLLKELNKVMEEDMEDLLEYEKKFR